MDDNGLFPSSYAEGQYDSLCVVDYFIDNLPPLLNTEDKEVIGHIIEDLKILQEKAECNLTKEIGFLNNIKEL